MQDEEVLGRLRTSTSHTIGVPHVIELLTTMPASATADDYRRAVIEDNVLDRPTHQGRLRTLRHLREIFQLDASSAPLFRAIREVFDLDADSVRVCSALVAYARDELFRASWPALKVPIGDGVSSADLEAAVVALFPAALGKPTTAKVGRNVGASWTQTGHLMGRTNKKRARAAAGPAAVSFAVAVAYGIGLRGRFIPDSVWFDLLDVPADRRMDALLAAHRDGLITVRSAGHVLDVEPGAISEVARR